MHAHRRPKLSATWPKCSFLVWKMSCGMRNYRQSAILGGVARVHSCPGSRSVGLTAPTNAQAMHPAHPEARAFTEAGWAAYARTKARKAEAACCRRSSSLSTASISPPCNAALDRISARTLHGKESRNAPRFGRLYCQVDNSRMVTAAREKQECKRRHDFDRTEAASGSERCCSTTSSARCRRCTLCAFSICTAQRRCDAAAHPCSSIATISGKRPRGCCSDALFTCGCP